MTELSAKAVRQPRGAVDKVILAHSEKLGGIRNNESLDSAALEGCRAFFLANTTRETRWSILGFLESMVGAKN